jgi:hypothetical protein
MYGDPARRSRPPSPCATKGCSTTLRPPGRSDFSATVVETAWRIRTAVPAASCPTPTTTVLPLGQSLRLGWQADATYDGCSIEATVPEGVVVPVSGGSAISSGSGWELPEAPPPGPTDGTRFVRVCNLLPRHPYGEFAISGWYDWSAPISNCSRR